MKIAGFNKLTLLDYPGYVACIIFTQGCNFRCPFCQNSDLIIGACEETITEEEVLNYLKKRINIIDGICISGGEPTIQKDIDIFIKKVKALGYKVKLDTNGGNPDKLKELLDANLLDYVAMDIKNDFENYGEICGKRDIDVEKIKQSIELLKNSKIDYEFRTTIIKEYHDINSIKKICDYIGKDVKYYLQNYQDSENVLKKGLHGFSHDELVNLEYLLKKKYVNLKIRGL